MAFTPKAWHNDVAGGTKLNAAALVDLEQRLSSYSDDVAATKQDAATAATDVELAALLADPQTVSGAWEFTQPVETSEITARGSDPLNLRVADTATDWVQVTDAASVVDISLGKVGASGQPGILFGAPAGSVGFYRAEADHIHTPNHFTSTDRIALDATDGSPTAGFEREGYGGITSFCAPDPVPEGSVRLRIQHPAPGPGVPEDFSIAPYLYGMAILYDGVVECWVDEWSIHNRNTGAESNGARLWVGNHDDTGGLHFTSYKVGATKYASMTAELFDRTSAGDLRFQVRDSGDKFSFLSGANGSEVEYMRITANGQAYFRYNQAEMVWVGAAGPANEAAIAFGIGADVRIYRKASDLAMVSKAIGTELNAAPADASLSAGEVALWFDQTNGAAKLKIKGKSADGTVVTGDVALA